MRIHLNHHSENDSHDIQKVTAPYVDDKVHLPNKYSSGNTELKTIEKSYSNNVGDTRQNTSSSTKSTGSSYPKSNETSYPKSSGSSYKPYIAENGDIKNADNDGDGRIEEVYVRGYKRKDGTYVRGHYRAKPRR